MPRTPGVGLLLAHLVISVAALGACWFVQLVHYPQFAGVGEAAWPAYHRDHVRRTGWVFAPLMLAQLGTAALVVGLLPAGASAPLAIADLVLTAAIFTVTFAAAVPLHGRLDGHFDPVLGRRLVRVNAVRTALWVAQAAVAVALVG
jgi:hypothetical protein